MSLGVLVLVEQDSRNKVVDRPVRDTARGPETGDGVQTEKVLRMNGGHQSKAFRVYLDLQPGSVYRCSNLFRNELRRRTVVQRLRDVRQPWKVWTGDPEPVLNNMSSYSEDLHARPPSKGADSTRFPTA
ncbi:hypothetical protein PTW37_16440 (plasmid) [Arthrobacter agilis]|uniref:hypothetical protein n=1 Tax=Arthrobacter agilis TaxID=37921 RepID=UPI002366C51E|nr:hypothetical protein [Arthrobacter agilis]WDF35091.1 hypothetical protein PTW37_16440 [Arthrobacter agilis]